MLAVAAGSDQLRTAIRSLEEAFLIGLEGVTEVWLVRHADCYRDLTTTEDPPLSALGRQQASRLAEGSGGSDTRPSTQALTDAPWRPRTRSPLT